MKYTEVNKRVLSVLKWKQLWYTLMICLRQHGSEFISKIAWFSREPTLKMSFHDDKYLRSKKSFKNVCHLFQVILGIYKNRFKLLVKWCNFKYSFANLFLPPISKETSHVFIVLHGKRKKDTQMVAQFTFKHLINLELL